MRDYEWKEREYHCEWPSHAAYNRNALQRLCKHVAHWKVTPAVGDAPRFVCDDHRSTYVEDDFNT